MGAASSETVNSVSEGANRGLAARVEWVAGFEISLDIAWDTFKGDAYETFTKAFFDPLIKAFQIVGRDRLDPLEGKLKRIVFRGSEIKSAVFKDGVLTIDDNESSATADERAARIVKALGY